MPTTDNDNNRSGFVTFDEQVLLICSLLGDDQGTKLYTKCARFLGLTLDDFNIKIIPNVKSIGVTIKDNMTIDLPEDFQDISKVGIVCEDNKLMIMGRDRRLCASTFKEPEVIECCTCPKEEDETMTDDQPCCDACSFRNFGNFGFSGGSAFLGDYLYGFTGYLYGYVPQNRFKAGTYDIDYQGNRLILGPGRVSCPGVEVVLEYIANLHGDDYRLIPKKAKNIYNVQSGSFNYQ